MKVISSYNSNKVSSIKNTMANELPSIKDEQPSTKESKDELIYHKAFYYSRQQLCALRADIIKGICTQIENMKPMIKK
jgi:hypothetical protein